MNRIRVDKGLSYSDVILLKEGADAVWDISVAAGASLQLTFVALASGDETLSCEISVAFEGEGGQCQLRGLYITRDSADVSFKVNMVHNLPHCTSRQLFKGILAGSSRTLFDGLIKVPAHCTGTEAYQENHNLLLSDDCRAQSLPQLEIYADDVKCSHGATFGRLDEDELFYMRSRGIPEPEARRLQMVAFAAEVLDGLPEDIVEEALASLENMLYF